MVDTNNLSLIRSTSTGWNLVSIRSSEDVDYVINALGSVPPQQVPPGSYVSVDWPDFYVSFGAGKHRAWADARQYGFVSAGQGTWYSNSLKQLAPGHRIFACIPKTGYVGVGIVKERAVPVRQFHVELDGAQTPILSAPFTAPNMGENADNPDLTEYLVRVEWIRTLPENAAFWEKGMFANQNSACRLTHAFTRERLLDRFELKSAIDRGSDTSHPVDHTGALGAAIADGQS
jgi:hypothetical protein